MGHGSERKHDTGGTWKWRESPKVGWELVLPDFVKTSGAGSPHTSEVCGGCHTRILCMYQVYALPYCIAYASFMIPRGFKI